LCPKTTKAGPGYPLNREQQDSACIKSFSVDRRITQALYEEEMKAVGTAISRVQAEIAEQLAAFRLQRLRTGHARRADLPPSSA
jgi:hypothetical protein